MPRDKNQSIKFWGETNLQIFPTLLQKIWLFYYFPLGVITMLLITAVLNWISVLCTSLTLQNMSVLV